MHGKKHPFSSILSQYPMNFNSRQGNLVKQDNQGYLDALSDHIHVYREER